MEDELYALLREACGDGKAAEIWKKFEERIESRCKMLKSANDGWQKQHEKLKTRCSVSNHPPYTTCAECADTVKVDEARWGPGGYCWCNRCFEAIECDDPGCHGHVSHPCENCGRRW